jgi:GTPase SAR1 family protein
MAKTKRNMKYGGSYKKRNAASVSPVSPSSHSVKAGVPSPAVTSPEMSQSSVETDDSPNSQYSTETRKIKRQKKSHLVEKEAELIDELNKLFHYENEITGRYMWWAAFFEAAMTGKLTLTEEETIKVEQLWTIKKELASLESTCNVTEYIKDDKMDTKLAMAMIAQHKVSEVLEQVLKCSIMPVAVMRRIYKKSIFTAHSLKEGFRTAFRNVIHQSELTRANEEEEEAVHYLHQKSMEDEKEIRHKKEVKRKKDNALLARKGIETIASRTKRKKNKIDNNQKQDLRLAVSTPGPTPAQMAAAGGGSGSGSP